MRIPTSLRGFLILFIAIFVIGYAIFVGRNYILGVSLYVSSPKDGEALTSSYLEIKGEAKRTTRLFVNGAKTFTDKTGFFSYALLVPSGYTIIDVTAEDRFGRSTTVRREVYYGGKQTTSTAPSTATSTAR